MLTEQKLTQYMDENARLKHYIGFEISGYVHLGTGLLCMRKLADFQKAGIETNVFMADYHSWINEKLGGNLDDIRAATPYFKEALKKSIEAVGGDPEKVNFILASDLYKDEGLKYFENVMKVSKSLTLSRAKRTLTITGKREGEGTSFAQLLYIPMQVADIFTMGINIAHAGMDQRKAHVVALESAKQFGYSPVAVHHHLLMSISLTQEQREKIMKAKASGQRGEFEEVMESDVKMSKSKPASAIFIHDSEEVVRSKIGKAFCPQAELDANPVIDLVRYVVWPSKMAKDGKIIISNVKTGAESSYDTLLEFEKSYAAGIIHPLDLKAYVADEISSILAPARKYFLEGAGKRYLEQLDLILKK